MKNLGPAGKVAEAFIGSKLTLLLVLASLLLGGFAVWRLPREEEPQIDVPMFDIFVPFPGAGAKEVEEQVVRVGERKLWEIPGVEYLYTTSEAGSALFIVRFKVGTDPEEAMTRVYTKTFANLDLLPPGAGQPLVKPRSIDDVPILALTLSGPGLDGYALRRHAAALREELAAVPEVSETELIGGRKRQLLVHFDPERLRSRRLTVLELAALIRGSNRRLPAGHVERGGRLLQLETDAFVRGADDLRALVVGVSGGVPVQLGDVATVSDGPDEEEREVFTEGGLPAVTLSVSKRRGANATTVSSEVRARIETLRPTLPAGLEIAVTRDYGRSAKEKSDELLFHMALATFSVAALVALALGLREALVVLVAVPVTLALTLLVYFLAGYTLNRITLFALIFSIGILVDDAIVVVENIHRHYALGDGRSLRRLAVDAVDEVGNPTILATWTVIAAILPMAFVGGLMGPYMRPIPVGASFAMLFSLAVAFIVSPWAFAWLLERWKPKACPARGETRLDRVYRRSMGRLLDDRRARGLYFGVLAALLLGAAALVPLRKVAVKMLPFDNKDEFEVVLDMPEDSALSRTKAAAAELSAALEAVPEVRRVTSYVGTAAPYDFNGLVRHYFLRRRPHQAELVVGLAGRHERKRQSHEVAKAVRPALAAIAAAYGARVQVAEAPPGPPVLSTLVFELYGPDAAKREALSARLRELLAGTEGIVDVGSYTPDAEPLRRLVVDREKATLNGLSPGALAETVALAVAGAPVDLAHLEGWREPVEIRLRLPERLRRDPEAAGRLTLFGRSGAAVSLKDLVRPRDGLRDKPIHRKNLMPVSYVVADVAGAEESPVYAMRRLERPIRELARAQGLTLGVYYASQPRGSLETALKWDGEWQITYEVFRDMGLAFALVLVLIYILVVAWFQDFRLPLVIMAPIPLTLVGILPAHWALGAFFTATSMIGFIAGAGIV
ncbi:MAG: efflux RND transporter permease subunit, partial [Elusimicrobia bacterium]|nr:efflux RND transporter permease subunit [Elusimicrobiota bacterium]